METENQAQAETIEALETDLRERRGVSAHNDVLHDHSKRIESLERGFDVRHLKRKLKQKGTAFAAARRNLRVLREKLETYREAMEGARVQIARKMPKEAPVVVLS